MREPVGRGKKLRRPISSIKSRGGGNKPTAKASCDNIRKKTLSKVHHHKKGGKPLLPSTYRTTAARIKDEKGLVGWLALNPGRPEGGENAAHGSTDHREEEEM